MHLWKRHVTDVWLAANESALDEVAPGAVVIVRRPGRRRALVEIACPTKRQALRLTMQFGGSAERLPRNWQRHFLQPSQRRPISIAGRLLIVAQPGAPPGENELIIPAAGAFGTGEHATTALCLRLLARVTRHWRGRWQLPDLGTGSGILALAGDRFGATRVVGLDVDPRAVAIARQNAERNGIVTARFKTADLLRWRSRARYQLITANLFSELLIAILPAIKQALAEAGCAILSGILREQLGGVQQALRHAHFVVKTVRRRGKWIALLVRPAAARSPASNHSRITSRGSLSSRKPSNGA